MHEATASNITNNYTVIDHPSVNGNPSAIVLVTQNWNPPGSGGAYNTIQSACTTRKAASARGEQRGRRGQVEGRARCRRLGGAASSRVQDYGDGRWLAQAGEHRGVMW
jgi:hypothetical protein